MTQSGDRPRRPRRTVIILIVSVGLIATAVAYLAVRETPQAPAPPLADEAGGAGLPVQTIVLPHPDPKLPPGPHQRTFATSCTICHSPRLPLTQPPFPRKVWEDEVHKMVKSYGAPVEPEAQEQIVDYLTAVRGK